MTGRLRFSSSGAPLQDRPHITGPHRASAAAELLQLLLATDGITDFLDHLVRLTVTSLGGDVWCAVTLRRDHHPVTVASSDARADQVDEVQYQHDEGPCLTSIATGEIVHVEDLVDEDRWGEYRPRALAHGVRSSLSLPLGTGGSVVGALNIYAGSRHAFSDLDRHHAEQYAAEVSRALALAVRITELTEMSAQLEEALASRAVIDQALGVIMGGRRCTADEAFAVLRTVSQNSNVKLRDVAAGMVATVSGRPAPSTARFSPRPGPTGRPS